MDQASKRHLCCNFESNPIYSNYCWLFSIYRAYFREQILGFGLVWLLFHTNGVPYWENNPGNAKLSEPPTPILTCKPNVVLLIAYLYCWIRTQIQTCIRTPNPMATMHYICRSFHIAQSQIQILILTANYRKGIGIWVHTRLYLSQCKWAIRNIRQWKFH